MDNIKEVFPGVWTFPIPLPDSPLKWLNCYVIKAYSEGRDLLIDTGFRHPLCLEALKKAMARLELVPERTDVFLTHVHPDHTGNAAYLQKAGCRIFMSAVDYELELRRRHTDFAFRFRLDEGGIPEETRLLMERNDSISALMPESFNAELVNDGDVLGRGEFELRCLAMPGHSPGHMCLYSPERKLLFLGDHVLYEISPHITALPSAPDALGDYLESLRRLSTLDVALALPAHRNFEGYSLAGRIAELIAHHEARLDETEKIVRSRGGLCAFDIAGLMTWNIRAVSWQDFPPSQQVFAYSETLSHLDYLVKRKRISCREEAGVKYYY